MFFQKKIFWKWDFTYKVKVFSLLDKVGDIEISNVKLVFICCTILNNTNLKECNFELNKKFLGTLDCLAQGSTVSILIVEQV